MGGVVSCRLIQLALAKMGLHASFLFEVKSHDIILTIVHST